MEDGASVSSASGGHGSSSASSSGEEVLIRIHVPELKVEKCMQFHKEDIVWDVKQQALANLPKELRESFNYGFFYPPQNGRAGKFLDEERPLSDYPFSGPVGYLELKYKRRVYKMLNLEEKSLKALHTRANLRRFMEAVKDNNVDKVAKMCSKGLDPNFHCQESGDTPLTVTTTRLKKCSRIIMTLVNGGALLDYRTREGLTPIHRAVQANNYEGVKTLLDLGTSPNYRDIRGLTPLYYTVTHNTDPKLCDILLHDYATMGACDNQGWQETHQACRNKLVQHLEHLLFYGADMNAQNASGNTPLHVCAVNNLEDCARVLLFRGCDKSALNYANQTPYQVAIIAGNMDLAQIIQNHSAMNVVPYKEPPKFNPKRRMSGVSLSRTHSDPRLEACLALKPPSPCPSNRSIPPFSSASSLSETSTGSGTNSTHPSEADSESCNARMGHGNQHSAHDNSDVMSDSSGVCTSNSGSHDSYDSTIAVNSNSSMVTIADVNDFNVGTLVVCVKKFLPQASSHLNINPGEIIEVTGSTDEGMLEGCFKGKIGLFPPHCVQEIRLRNPKAVRENLIGRIQNRSTPTPPTSTSSHVYSQPESQNHYGTTPRMKMITPKPRTVVLERGKKGFGFVLRGAKATSPMIERPYDRGPALQYLDDVDPGGVADESKLKKGDYILEINDEDVSQASHEHVVNLIKKAGDTVKMKIQSPTLVFPNQRGLENLNSPHYQAPNGQFGFPNRGCQTLPRKLSNGVENPIYSEDASTEFKAVYATTGRGTLPPPAPPPRDPKTTLSVGRARARSMVSGLQDFEDCMQNENGPTDMTQSAYYMSQYDCTASESPGVSSSNVEGGYPHTNGMIKLASINPRAVAKRMSVTSLEQELALRESQGPGTPKVYASVAEMKKAKALKARLVAESTRLHKDFHSTPDLQGQVVPVALSQHSSDERRLSLSQEQLLISGHGFLPNAASHTLSSFEKKNPMCRQFDTLPSHSDHQKLRRSVSAINTSQMGCVLPPPSHPPPPVPGCNVATLKRNGNGDYATIRQAAEAKENEATFNASNSENGDFDNSSYSGSMSSFKPADSAKVYASPFSLKNKNSGYSETADSGSLQNGTSKSRSQSLPPVNRQRDPGAKDTEIYVSGQGTLRKKSGMTKGGHMQDNQDYSANNQPMTQTKSILGKPNIPDPDYSSEDESCSLQEGIKKRPLKKKKQTVMFAPNLVSAPTNNPAPPQTSEPTSILSSNNFADLIAQKAAERKARQGSSGGSAPASASSSPMKRKENKEPVCLTDAIKESNLFNKQRQKVMENSSSAANSLPDSPNQVLKTTVDKDSEAKKAAKHEISKVLMKNSRSCPNDIVLEDGDNSSSGVSSDQEHVHPDPQHYVTVINTENNKHEIKDDRRHSKDDSSEASESSDEASDRTWIMTDKLDRNDSGRDSDSSTGSRRSGTLTKNAVSLVKLPPPQESNERESDQEIQNSRVMAKSLDQDSLSTLSSLSSLSSVSCSSCEKIVQQNQMSIQNGYSPETYNNDTRRYSQPILASQSIRSALNRSYNNTSRQNCSKECHTRSAEAESISNPRERISYVANKSATLDRNFFNSHRNSNSGSWDSLHNKYDRSIDESLQLIRQHMDSLNEVNSLAGIKSHKAPASSDVVLAPPPEFCDTSGQRSMNGASSKRPGKTIIHINPDERENDLPVRIIRKSSSSSLTTANDLRVSFRNKQLPEWSINDTTEWLESLYMPEYVESFSNRNINGHKLMELNNEKLINLGIRKIGHRVKMEKSLKRYRPVERIDL